MKNIWPYWLLQEPNPDKTIEEIWDDFDGYSFEDQYMAPELQKSLTFTVLLPPLNYQNKFVKGFCFSQGMSLFLQKAPELKDLFITCGNSMTFSYPRARDVDCYFTCYKNLERERYYKKKYPETNKIICLPVQDADFTNERVMNPIEGTTKDIDVFCMSTPFPVKNLPIIANALKIYEKLYGRRLKVVYALGANEVKKLPDGSIDYSELGDYGKKELQKVDEIFEGKTKEYIDFIPYIYYYDLPKYFSRSKSALLGSLYEGKNRFIHEARSADTPIIVFNDFNKFMRGETPIFYENSGEFIPEFTAESMAKTIHKVITNEDKYSARENYLKYNGRYNMVKQIVNHIPYYQQNIPDFKDGNLISNTWVNQACKKNYGFTFEELLYDADPRWTQVVGVTNSLKLISDYRKEMGLKEKQNNIEKKWIVHLKQLLKKCFKAGICKKK